MLSPEYQINPMFVHNTDMACHYKIYHVEVASIVKRFKVSGKHLRKILTMSYRWLLAIRSINVSNLVETLSIMGMLPNYSNGDFQDRQRQDKHLSTVISWLAWDHEPSKQEMQMCSPATHSLWHCKSQLKFENDVLYYVWEDNMKSRSLLVAPDSLKPEILRLCHDIRSFGHLRHDKTLTKLRKMAFWYGMATQCKLYVASCHVCNKQKKPCRKARADLGQYHSGIPYERVHVDILGSLPITKTANKYILIIIVQFTNYKWIECCAILNQHATTVAKVLMDRTISRFGCLLELHTDQGRNVDENIMRQLCSLLEISKTRTTAYHPASYGQVEWYNRLIA